MESYKLYVGGNFKETASKITVVNSYSNQVFAEVSLASANELETAIKAAQDVKKTIAHLASFHRYAILMDIAGLLRTERQRLANVLAMEACKPVKLALAEVDRAIQVFVVAAEESKRLPKEYISMDWTPAGQGREGLVKYFPVGLVAGISPFNFPLNLAVHKIAPAIAAGCPIILKPSSSTPLSALELARLVDKTELPKGALSVLPMDRKTGNLLVTDERFNLLSFTGSPEVGWKMKSDAGKKKVVLELGGNAGVIITASADIGKAVGKCVAGGFSYAGQVCIHTQRIFVHKSIVEDFTALFVEKVKQLRQGAPEHPETDISAMIDEKNAMRVESWVNEAVAGGARLLCGGQRKGSFFEPTVISSAKNSMNICCCEIFGPVVVLEPYEDFEKAVEEVNNSRYGLQAGVFTDSVAEMDYAFDNLEVGGVIINDVPTFRTDHMPYGGIKDSGLGREGVKYAILDMMEPRLLVK
ncbi:MAG TPA: aldehyde dehydrogenase family protein [Bacteroidales bacterium]|jgi:glyceraldehyde-3-phosphate dehydrogenase (NADP+)|nr:aldehyde dehydrogenase family protein [Bacteroidales bacterium]HNZ42277.1 aldehyde dehydrogenase family protein [Bacteroidales bacterium]HOH83794.1 aldehyde dehydrogenase family protein [Bacteroidales bacterium]HPB24754.1 aldehyde dehydrogenase family protein [Bacteroidales bacterium]HPI29823.1 aldehyde dehydrogenase family protein [Bacteroidales bacterium]